jgi:D-alanine-D-alanine ligase
VELTRETLIAHVQQSLPALRSGLKVAVLYNGNPAEPGAVIRTTHNPRSSKSYRPVAEHIAHALIEQGFEHVVTLPDDMRLGERLRGARIDFAWINSAGVQGYNAAAHTPSVLEMLGVPYVGHSPLNAGTLDNKHAFKYALQAMGIPTAPFITWDGSRGPFAYATSKQFQRVFGDYLGPFVVKPTSGRASQNVVVVEGRRELDTEVARISALTRNTVLVETFLPGLEYAVAVCGPVLVGRDVVALEPDPVAFSAVQRLLGPDERIFTSMDVKPITTARARLLDPKADTPVHGDLLALARRIYTEFDLDSLIRLDVRADAHGVLHVLEANPKPDLSAPNAAATNLVVMGLAQLAMTYGDLIESLLVERIFFYLWHRRPSVPHLAVLVGLDP